MTQYERKFCKFEKNDFMKKLLLYASLLTPGVFFAQSMDLSNEPTVGQSNLLFLCDSLTDPLSSTTGSGISWDYSQIIGLNGQTKVIEVVDPATTPDASSFTTSTKAFAIQGSIMNYYNSTATERISQGFVFQEPTFGTVLATFDTDPQTTVQYPFGVGSSFEDAFSGQLSFTFNGIPQNPTCTGLSYASIDGMGTLKLPNSNIYSNVIRYKIVDTLFTQVVFVVPLDIQLIRTQYEYYDYAGGNLPVFIHSNVILQQTGATTPLLNQTVVLSSVEPTNFMNVGSIESDDNLQVTPNPSEGTIFIKGLSNDGLNEIKVLDQAGKEVYAQKGLINMEAINLSFLNSGNYMLIINSNNKATFKQIFLK
jgi:hypothetical protein